MTDGHTGLFYHYENPPTFWDYEELEDRLTTEERLKMTRTVNAVISNIKHSSYENRLLAEKMMKMGYLFQYMKPMNLLNHPPTEPPDERK